MSEAQEGPSVTPQPNQPESTSGKELAVSPQTEALAGFLRSKVGFPGTELSTRGDEQGKGTIMVQVPDVPKGQTARVFRFAGNEDAREFYERAKEAEGLRLSLHVDRVEGNMETFGVDRLELTTFEDFRTYQFLVNVGNALAKNTTIGNSDQ
jgi:hypothetical protein